MSHRRKIALVGNPNCGKTTLFNLLTGLNQRVGNFPGVTVNKKTGVFTLPTGEEVELIDLPGTYGLSSDSEDEKIAQGILLNPNNPYYPDVVLIVLDATNLKRNLFLATQIIDTGLPCVVALNMVDALEDKGISVDTDCLSKALSTPVVLISAKQKRGIEELLENIAKVSFSAKDLLVPIPQSAKQLTQDLVEQGLFSNQYVALKSINNEAKYSWVNDLDYEKIEEKYKYNRHAAELFEINDRYAFIDTLIEHCITIETKVQKSRDKIERLVIHPVWGTLLFLFVFFSLFQTVFTLSAYPMEWIGTGIEYLADFASKVLPEGNINSFIVDGLIAGIGGVVVFLPQIMLLFGFITILEDSGYLSRISFISDKILSYFGMNGKSIIPLVGGFACAVPAIMATRNIENQRERLITLFITPLMSCSARLPVYVFLVSYIVPREYWLGVVNLQGLFMMGLYLLGIVFSLLIALVLNKFLPKANDSSFILELPNFKLPSSKNVLFSMWNKGKIFVRQAGKIIIIVSIALWFLSSFGPSKERKLITEKYNRELLSRNVDANQLQTQYKSELLEHSYIGHFGKAIEPVIRPLGFDWKIGIALITSFAAREVFVGTMETIYSVGGTNQQTKKIKFTLPTAFSLLIFYVFALQCMSTLAIVKQETGSWKIVVLQLFVFTGLAYLGSWVTFQVLS